MPELIAYLEMSSPTTTLDSSTRPYFLPIFSTNYFANIFTLFFWPIRGQFDQFDQSEGNLTNKQPI